MGKELIDNAEDMKPLSVAVKELYEGKIKIVDNTSSRRRLIDKGATSHATDSAWLFF